MKSITKLSYKLNKEEFNKKLEELKKNSSFNFLTFSKHSFFFTNDEEINNLVTNLHILFFKFDSLIEGLGSNIKTHLLQSFLIEEIKSTNKIEIIFSTKKDIFKTLNHIDEINLDDKKIKFIVNAYKDLLVNESKNRELLTHESLRKTYEKLFNKVLDKETKIDGKYYRKESVFINDGFKNIHQGLNKESNIIKGMDEFLSVYNSSSTDLFIKVILSHFLFEYIHPYYDANGRMGRFLISKKIFEETSSILSSFISTIILKNKNKYYKIFKDSENIKEKGSLSYFVYSFLKLMNEEINELILKMKELKELVNEIYNNEFSYIKSKSEKEVINYLIINSLFTHYGVSNKEILNECKVKKRNLIYILNKLKKNNKIKETCFGTYKFKKLIINNINPLFSDEDN